MMRRTWKRALIGFVIGMVIGNLISLCMNGSQDFSQYVGSDRFLPQTVLSGVLGAISMAGVSFYDIEDWSLLKTAVLHYLLIMAAYLPIALTLGWIEPKAEQIVLMALLMAAGYALIWVIMYVRYQAEVKKLNRLLKESQDDQKPD